MREVHDLYVFFSYTVLHTSSKHPNFASSNKKNDKNGNVNDNENQNKKLKQFK